MKHRRMPGQKETNKQTSKKKKERNGLADGSRRRRGGRARATPPSSCGKHCLESAPAAEPHTQRQSPFKKPLHSKLPRSSQTKKGEKKTMSARIRHCRPPLVTPSSPLPMCCPLAHHTRQQRVRLEERRTQKNNRGREKGRGGGHPEPLTSSRTPELQAESGVRRGDPAFRYN